MSGVGKMVGMGATELEAVGASRLEDFIMSGLTIMLTAIVRVSLCWNISVGWAVMNSSSARGGRLQSTERVENRLRRKSFQAAVEDEEAGGTSELGRSLAVTVSRNR